MKHISPKYLLHGLIWLGIFLWWITTVYILAAPGATEFRLNDQLTWQFGSTIFVFTNRTDIDFKYGGNKKVWLYLARSLKTLTTGEVVELSWGTTGVCFSKIRWIYYNNERGERLRPLDQNTLTGLQAINSTGYSGMQLSGGLFTNCTGLGGTTWNVYGQLMTTYNTTTYYLIAGTTENFSTNMHGTGLSGSLLRKDNNLTWYIRDSYGGIWVIAGNSSCSYDRAPSPSTVCAWTSFTQTSSCGNTQVVSWTKNCTVTSNWAGGGSTLTQDNCMLNTTSKHNLSWANEDGIDYSPSYYDNNCSWPESKIQHKPTLPLCSAYSAEINWAYECARSFDITTINQCTNANMYGTLIRKDLAKMMVNFATYVFNRNEVLVHDTTGCALFSDLPNESKESKRYIQKACEYGLMGLHPDGLTPQAKFNPYGEVTRAQFGTVLSRFLRLLDYSIGNDSKLPYYTKHLQALKKAGIMINISNPSMKELRWRVMLMMQRIYEKK